MEMVILLKLFIIRFQKALPLKPAKGLLGRSQCERVELMEARLLCGSYNYDSLRPENHLAPFTAVEADVALLMVTAEQRIFEDGIYDDGSVLGRTVEHAELAFSLGLSKLIVVVNKLDDVTEGESRYNEIVQKLEGCLQNIGFEGVVFLPMSTLYGSNILKGVGDEFGWWRGPSLFEAIDTIEPQPRALGNTILVDRLIARITINKRSEHVVTAEYSALFCSHRAIVGCEITEIRKDPENPFAADVNRARAGDTVIAYIKLKKITAVERFGTFPYFGSFALSDEGCCGVLAVGEVLGIPEWRGVDS
ncbi:elongation factor 1-alpha-like [Raphanus sativus]|nr:elongation factor 1-alpha-like [Raphanus sativus]